MTSFNRQTHQAMIDILFRIMNIMSIVVVFIIIYNVIDEQTSDTNPPPSL